MKPKRKNKPGQGRKPEGRKRGAIFMLPEAWSKLDAQCAGAGATRGQVLESLLGLDNRPS